MTRTASDGDSVASFKTNRWICTLRAFGVMYCAQHVALGRTLSQGKNPASNVHSRLRGALCEHRMKTSIAISEQLYVAQRHQQKN